MLQLGEVRRVIREPGLKMKRPFIEDVITYDKRVLDFEPPHEEVIVSDQKRLVVDAYTRYRIVNPLQFYQTVGTEAGVRARLSSLVTGSLRRVLGSVTLSDILSAKRDAIMIHIRDDVAAQAQAVRHRGRRRAAAPRRSARRRTARRFTPACSPSANSRRGNIAAKAPRRRRPCGPMPTASARHSGRRAARRAAGARRRRCPGNADLWRRVRAGQAVLCVLSLAAGLSRRAQRQGHCVRAVARGEFLPLLRRCAGAMSTAAERRAASANAPPAPGSPGWDRRRGIARLLAGGRSGGRSAGSRRFGAERRSPRCAPDTVTIGIDGRRGRRNRA